MTNPFADVTCYPGQTFFMSGYWYGSVSPGTCGNQGSYTYRMRFAYRVKDSGAFGGGWKKILSVGSPLTVPSNDAVVTANGGISSEYVNIQRTVTCRTEGEFQVAMMILPGDPMVIGGKVSDEKYEVDIVPYDSHVQEAEQGNGSPVMSLDPLASWYGEASGFCDADACEARDYGSADCDAFETPNLLCPNYNWNYSVTDPDPGFIPQYLSRGYYLTNEGLSSGEAPDHGGIVLRDGKSFERTLSGNPAGDDLPQAGNYYVTLRTGFTEPYAQPAHERLEVSITRNGQSVYSFTQRRPDDATTGLAFYECVSPELFYIQPGDGIAFTGYTDTSAEGVHVDSYSIAGTRPVGLPDCNRTNLTSLEPTVTSVSCDMGDGTFRNCALAQLNDTMTRIRVECYDIDNDPIDEVNVALDGATAGHIFDEQAQPYALHSPPTPSVFIADIPAEEQHPLLKDEYTLTATCRSTASGSGTDAETGVLLTNWEIGVGNPPVVGQILCDTDGDGANFMPCASVATAGTSVTHLMATCTDPDTVAGGTSGWSDLTTMPVNVASAAVAIVNSTAYVIGGELDGGSLTDAVYAYDFASDTWEQKTTLPGGTRRSATAVGAAGKVYVMGGYDGANAVSRVDVYDPDTDTWASGGPMAPARYDHAATYASGKIYVYGGYDDSGTLLQAMKTFDSVTLLWEAASSSPGFPIAAVASPAMTTYGNDIYIFGGTRQNQSTGQPEVSDAVWHYIIDQAVWDTVPITAQFHRTGMTAHEVGGSIYLLGGQDENGVAQGGVWSYTPGVGSPWTDLTSLTMTGPRTAFGSVDYQSTFVVFGGTNGSQLVSGVEGFNAGTEFDSDISTLKFSAESGDDGTLLSNVSATDIVEPNTYILDLTADPISIMSDIYAIEAVCTDSIGFTDRRTIWWSAEVPSDAELASITPSYGYTGEPEAPVLDIAGKRFPDNVRVWIENGSGIVQAELDNIVLDNADPEDTHISGTFDLGTVSPGSYAVKMEDLDSGYRALGSLTYIVREHPGKVQSHRPILSSQANGTIETPDTPIGVTLSWTFDDPLSCTGGDNVGLSCGVAADCPGAGGGICSAGSQQGYQVVMQRCTGDCTDPHEDQWSTVEDSGWVFTADSTYTPSLSLTDGVVYRWHVRTLDNGGFLSPWSFKQSDGLGGDWINITGNGLPDENDLTEDRFVGHTLAIHPLNDTIRYLAISDAISSEQGGGATGLYRSEDSGASWTKVTPVFSPVLSNPSFTDIVLRPSNDQEIIVGTYYREMYDGLWYSSDRGNHFTRVAGAFSGAGAARIHINALDTDRLVIENKRDPVADLFAVEDNGTSTWTTTAVGVEKSGIGFRIDDVSTMYMGATQGLGSCTRCIQEVQYDGSGLTDTQCSLSNVDSGVSSDASMSWTRFTDIAAYPFSPNEDTFFFTWQREQDSVGESAHIMRTTTAFTDPDGVGVGTPACESVFQYPAENAGGVPEWVSGFRLEVDPYDENALYAAPAEGDPPGVQEPFHEINLYGHNGDMYRLSNILALDPTSVTASSLGFPNDHLDMAFDAGGTLWVSTRNNNYGTCFGGPYDGMICTGHDPVDGYIDESQCGAGNTCDTAGDGDDTYTGWLWQYDASWGYFIPTSLPAPVVTAITPDYGYNNQSNYPVTIDGAHFVTPCADGTAQIRLDAPSITVNVTGNGGGACTDVSDTRIEGYLDLTGIPDDVYYVSVENPDGQGSNTDVRFTVFGDSTLAGHAWAGAATDTASLGCGGGSLVACATPGWLRLNPAYGGVEFEYIDNDTFDLAGYGWFGASQSPTGQKALGWLDFSPAGPYPDVDLDGNPLSYQTDALYKPTKSQIEGWGRITALERDGMTTQCIDTGTVIADTGPIETEAGISWDAVPNQAAHDTNGDGVADNCTWSTEPLLCSDPSMPAAGNCGLAGWDVLSCTNTVAAEGLCAAYPATNATPLFIGCAVSANAESYTLPVPPYTLTGGYDPNATYYLTLRADFAAGSGDTTENVEVTVDTGINQYIFTVQDQNNHSGGGINLETCSFGGDNDGMTLQPGDANTITFYSINGATIPVDWYRFTNFEPGYPDCATSD